MDSRLIIGIIVGGALLWAFIAFSGECGQLVRALGGGIFDVIKMCVF